MLAVILLVVAAARTCRPVITRPVSKFVCATDARNFNVEADFVAVHSVSVQAADSRFTAQCIVNITAVISSERRQNVLLPLLLLVKVERLRLNSPEDAFYVSMPNGKLRTDNYCVAPNCDPTYLWASQSVVLYLYVTHSSRTLASYEAEFVVTEATNVCGLANRSGDLVVQNSDRKTYAFASEPRHKELPPNNATCTVGLEYSMTIRPSEASASLNVSVLACPTDKRCATLVLDGRSCSDGVMVSSAPPGLPITLRYVFSGCSHRPQVAGFVVSAIAYVSVEPPSAAATVSSRPTSASMAHDRATTKPTISVADKTRFSSSMRTFSAAIGSRSIEIGATVVRAADTTNSPKKLFTTRNSFTAAAVTSSSADTTAERELVESTTVSELTTTVVTASVAALAATALVIGITVALICHRRRLRSPRQKPQERAFFHSRSAASASAEQIAMLDNDLYGVALASTTTAQQ